MSFEIFAVYHQQKTVCSLILYLNVYLGLPLVLAECTHCIYMYATHKKKTFTVFKLFLKVNNGPYLAAWKHEVLASRRAAGVFVKPPE